VTLVVARGDTAIANTREVEVTDASAGTSRVRFATTAKLPTYLVAFAVGPLDVVEGPALPPHGPRAHAIPLRGAAARGRGPELAYALAHTRPLVEALERWFAIPYPFEKLDLIAVPDFAAGAMENAGAITYREALLLIDPATAPEEQKRGFAIVHAHELAHHWFGNLVTMPWWDDIWLNEAFATWMSAKIVDEVYPEQRAGIALLQQVQAAMASDSLVSARSIRQPIGSDHDIRNAFDAITYSKGAGVLAMFERWLGADAFRDGIRRYLGAHRFGSATSADLFDALSAASGRDVEGPFRTFLEQPGVPFLEATPECAQARARLHLRQSRYLPAGSTGSQAATWQIPVCARIAGSIPPRETCSLLSEAEGILDLGEGGCGVAVLPNADAAGYYRWSLSGEALAQLTGGAFTRLGLREKLSLADALGAGFATGALSSEQVFAALPPFARDPDRAVARSLMGVPRFARDWLVPPAQRGRVEAFTRELYGPALARVGWQAEPGEDGDRRLLRAELIDLLAQVGRDRGVRASAASLGRSFLGLDADGALHPEAVPAELVGTALALAVEDGDARIFEAALAHLHATTDGLRRSQLLWALGTTTDPELAERARQLALDPRVRISEITIPLHAQLRDAQTRDAAWAFVEAHWDALVARLSERGAGGLPWLAAAFCDEAHAARAEAFLGPRSQHLPGAPRNLAAAIESMRVCAAWAALQRESAQRYFAAAS
jgi:alanyl aminopeptidase